jgi:hypothetical protein
MSQWRTAAHGLARSAAMRRALPLAAVILAVAGVAALQPGQETGACAQGGAVAPRADCGAAASVTRESCDAVTESFRAVRVRPVGRGLRLNFTRRVSRPAQIDVFQVSTGRVVLGQRLVARFSRRTGAVRWSGRAQRGRPPVRDGVLFARFRIRDERGRVDERRIALVRTRGRFRLRPDFYRRTSCATLTSYKLERPVFGGRRSRALGISFRLARAGQVTVEVRRAGRLVRRFGPTARRTGVTHRVRLPAERLRRGTYEISLVYAGDQSSLRAALFAQRL